MDVLKSLLVGVPCLLGLLDSVSLSLQSLCRLKVRTLSAGPGLECIQESRVCPSSHPSNLPSTRTLTLLRKHALGEHLHNHIADVHQCLIHQLQRRDGHSNGFHDAVKERVEGVL